MHQCRHCHPADAAVEGCEVVASEPSDMVPCDNLGHAARQVSVRDCDEKELVVPRLSASHLRISSANFFQQTESCCLGMASVIKVEESVDSLGFGFVDLRDAPCLTMMRGKDAEREGFLPAMHGSL